MVRDMRVSYHRGLELLKKNPIRNISIINYLDSHPDATLQQFGQSLLIKKEGVVYISSRDPQELDTILSNLDEGDTFFASLEEWIAQIIKGDRDTKWYLHMPRYILPLDRVLPSQTHPVQPIGTQYVEMVAKSWLYDDADEGSSAYVLACLNRGPTAAVFLEGEPVAWAAVHEDGALGFLFTKEEYRGRGFAQSITINLINQQRKLGRTSFVNIEEGKNSLGLAMKLGFVRYGSTCWIEF